MRKLIMVCLVFALVLGLCACGGKTAGGDNSVHNKPDDGIQGTTEAAQGTTEEVPQSTTQASDDDEPAQSTTEATQPEEPDATEPEEKSYLQRIERPDQSIYDGPGYDYGFVGVVEMKATYTIVEEQVDDEGILWGRLKSGIGWVDLDDVRKRNEAREVVSGNYADNTLLKQDNVHQCVVDDSEFRELLAFRFYEDVTNVCFRWLDWDGETRAEGPMIFHIPEVKAGEAFVAGVVFYGDMTMFSLSCVDGDGVTHYYSVSVSGRNGSLVFTEYQP